MITWIFPLHVTAVTLFLIFLVYKTLLLIFNKKNLLKKLRNKTKFLEVILGILVIASGVILFLLIGYLQSYFIAKLILVLIAIPLSIIGMKKENKILATLSVLLFIYIYAVSATKSISFNSEKIDFEEFEFDSTESGQANEILNATQSASLQQGKVIYKVLCAECHGEDGEKEINNAPNLVSSQLSVDEQITIITLGKGAMKGYDAELSEQEIELVASYTETLQE